MLTSPKCALHFLIACALLAASGCPSRPPSGEDGAAPRENPQTVSDDDTAAKRSDRAPRLSAAELVAKMQEIYADAGNYSDEGVLRWQYAEDNAWQPMQARFSTTYVRPNKLSLRVRGLHVASDGEMLRAVIKDEATGNYDGQVLERKAPETLQLADLYSDPEIGNILGDAIVDGTPWPLRLLTDDPILEEFFSGAIGKMSDKTINGRAYRRVRVRNGGRAATLWIDPATYLLRRVELPQPDPELGVRAFVAEFPGAKINEDGGLPAEAFRLERPQSAKIVRFFVPPPMAVDLPTPLFGKEVGDFALETADDKVVERDELGGSAVVLAWFLDNEPSQVTLQELQKVADELSADRDVPIYAVSPLPEAVTTESIRQSLDDMDVSLPLLRDTTAVGRDTFAIGGAPTVVVLDDQFRVQAFKAGADPELSQYLPMLIENLLEGKNPAGELRRQIADEVARYRRQLAAARADGSSTVLELGETPLAPQRGPQRLKLTRLWTSAEVKNPGNLTVIPRENGAPRILVHDHEQDWRTLVEIDANGNVQARRQLPVPRDAAIAVLRTIVDKDGRRWYAGSAVLGRQVFVFNDKFELAFAYPSANARHEGVGDFTFVDFEGNGEPQLVVGFWGVVGVHGVDMTGRRTWTNRTAAPVVALAPSPPNEAGWRQVLTATDRGEIVPINGFGKHDPPERLENYAVTELISSGFMGEGASAYMGTALQSGGSPLAVALSRDLQVRWDVPLPAGTHRNQIEPITSGQLLPGSEDAGQWIFAGADGSIGIVSDDASFFDSFTTGQRLAGVATAQLGEDRALLLSTPEGVTAWKVQRVQRPSR